MPVLDVQGTKFTFSVLPLKGLSRGFWVHTALAIKNEFIDYKEIGKSISREELESLIFALHRLLAGAYAKEYNITFEKAKIAIDLFPYTDNGMEASRADRRNNDCVMAFRLLMQSKDKDKFLGGVYSLLFHREDIQKFAKGLREEFEAAFARFGKGRGKHLFVGVSPLGYHGCNYWYLDKSGETKPGDYVWVRMGRHNTEQIVYVDNIKYCTDDTAPYDPERVKQVLKKATLEEIEECKKAD